MARTKQWSDFSPAQQSAIVIAAVAELLVAAIALRDLILRPADEVRGWKVAWAFGLFVQPIQPPLYLIAGRRRSRH